MWVKIPALQGTERHDLLRWDGVPVAAIKKRDKHWYCTLLCRTGISVVPLELPLSLTVPQVKAFVEITLREMGWSQSQKSKGNERGTVNRG